MARNRMISPEFYLDEELAEVSPFARLLYIGTWLLCDDINATLPNRPKWIKAQVFPYDSVNVEKLLMELITLKKLLPFIHNEEPFLFIKNFNKHQRVEKPSQKRKYPEYIANSPRLLGEDSPTPPDEVKISISKEKEKINTGLVEFLNYFNERSGKHYEVTNTRREKLEARLKKYSMDHLFRATDALLKSPFHIGKNNTNTWYADPDFLLRSDEQIDKWLNASVPHKLPVIQKPMLADSIL